MKGTTNPARLEQITQLAREFRAFTKIFADILKVKDESALIAQNQLDAQRQRRCVTSSTISPSNADEAELPAIELGAKKVDRAVSGGDGARQYVRRSTPTRRSPPARWRV